MTMTMMSSRLNCPRPFSWPTTVSRCKVDPDVTATRHNNRVRARFVAAIEWPWGLDRASWFLWFLWFLWALSSQLSAASTSVTSQPQTSGGEVVVVYNKNVPESKSLAQYYAQKRGVPSDQIFGFSMRPVETIRRDEFRDDLEKPLAKALEQKKLWHTASTLATFTN